jgi:hypothetical protein
VGVGVGVGGWRWVCCADIVLWVLF